MRVMKVPARIKSTTSIAPIGDKGLIAMANTAASAMVAWCRMPNGQAWEDYIEAENTGREQKEETLRTRAG